MTFSKRLQQFMNAVFASGYYAGRMYQFDPKSKEYDGYAKLLSQAIERRIILKRALELYDPKNK